LQAPELGEVAVECVIDTGFEGFLTLPVAMVTNFGLPHLGPMKANLADNSRIITQVYEGTILWEGVIRSIPILAMGNRPLLGTALMADYHLSIDFYEGGTVSLDDLI
jgi:clan AA aspartic protease